MLPGLTLPEGCSPAIEILRDPDAGGRLGVSRRVLGFKGRDGGFHPTMGLASIRDEDGNLTWESGWRLNALTDQGEDQVLRTYFLEEAHKTKYWALLNQAAAADPIDTDTIATVVETKTPATNGYNRVQVLSTDWGAPALVSGDYKTTAAQKTLGPAATTAWTVSHVALVTTLAGVTSPATLLILWIALGGAQTVPIGQTFNFQGGVTAL